MRKFSFIFLILIFTTPARAQLTVDTFLNMSGGNEGDIITATIANAGTNGSCGGWVTWTTENTAGPITQFTVAAAAKVSNLQAPVTISGTAYDGSASTFGWNYNHLVSGNKVRCTFTTNSKGTIWSSGMFYQTQVGAGNCADGINTNCANRALDLLHFVNNGAGRPSCIAHLNDFLAPAYGIRAHTGVSDGVTIVIVPNTLYWLTNQVNLNTLVCKVRVYNGTTFALVGESVTNTATFNSNSSWFEIGGEFHTATEDTNDYMYGPIVDLTNGIFPLLPAVANIESAPDGSGSIIAPQTVTTPLSMYSVLRVGDTVGQFVSNQAATWSLVNKTGGVVNGDLVAAGDNKSAVFTNHTTGAANAQGIFSGLSGLSGLLTVSPSAANKTARLRLAR